MYRPFALVIQLNALINGIRGAPRRLAIADFRTWRDSHQLKVDKPALGIDELKAHLNAVADIHVASVVSDLPFYLWVRNTNPRAAFVHSGNDAIKDLSNSRSQHDRCRAFLYKTLDLV